MSGGEDGDAPPGAQRHPRPRSKASTRRRVAVFAPLKPPHHPVPSGERQIARQLMAALGMAGHAVGLASDLRIMLKDPEDRATHDALRAAAERERRRIAAVWRAAGPPDLWLCYHPYYKSPDLLGPPLCQAHGVPWVTLEASISPRRAVGHWAGFQAEALAAVRGARVNIAFTGRDAEGLRRAAPDAPRARLAPFIAAKRFFARDPQPEPNRLVTVAMMRRGDKFDSYALLAEALGRLGDLDWRISLVGDGPARAEIAARFAALPPGRVDWEGALPAERVVEVLARGALFVWPGFGEAFGLAYLEAQAMGLPVVAQDVAGVGDVVQAGRCGILTPAGDADALAAAIRRLLSDDALRRRMGAAARAQVRAAHTLDGAARSLEDILARHVWARDG